MNDIFMPTVHDTGPFSSYGEIGRYYLKCPVPECGGSPAHIAYGSSLDNLKKNVFEITDKYKENSLGYPTHSEWKKRVEDALLCCDPYKSETLNEEEFIVKLIKTHCIDNNGYSEGINSTSFSLNGKEKITKNFYMKPRSDHVVFLHRLVEGEIHRESLIQIISLVEQEFICSWKKSKGKWENISKEK